MCNPEPCRILQEIKDQDDQIIEEFLQRQKDQACIIMVADQRTDSLFHFPGGLVGEGHTKNIGGINAVVLHQIGITAHQKLCLPAAGACDYPDIALGFQRVLLRRGAHGCGLPCPEPCRRDFQGK